MTDNEASEDLYLCFECVEDRFLKQKIKTEGQIIKCSFCGEPQEAFHLEQVSDLIEKVFESHFERTSTEPSAWEYAMIKELDYDWDREGDQVQYVICEIAGVDEDIALAIGEILSERHSDWEMAKMSEECEFDKDSHYIAKSINGHNLYYHSWADLERRLQTECRFISRSSQQTLEEVFAGLDKLKTRNHKSVVQLIGEKNEISELYRARVFQSIEGLEKGLARPDREVGPPPIGTASAGRMNAHGISVFYGALTPDTALAEVRPPVGSYVITTKFKVTRELRVLNISALKEILIQKSYFDPEHQQLLERAAFLGTLSGKLTSPVMPEREGGSYLITQVVAEFLASEFNLDGMIYPSVQVSEGVNLVLFHQASRSADLEIPEGTSITVQPDGWDEDGPSDDFRVIENVPPRKNNESSIPTSNGDPLGITLEIPLDITYDRRPISLRILVDQTKVHRVKSVIYNSSISQVTRSRNTRKSD